MELTVYRVKAVQPVQGEANEWIVVARGAGAAAQEIENATGRIDNMAITNLDAAIIHSYIA